VPEPDVDSMYVDNMDGLFEDDLESGGNSLGGDAWKMAVSKSISIIFSRMEMKGIRRCSI
jgi:hypothetical protein